MTYARLESYRSSQIFQIVFNHYMEEDERGFLNLGADKIYATTTATTKGETKPKEPKEETKKPKSDASPRVSLADLTNPDERNKKQKEWQQSVALLKNLIKTLYGDQPFYEKMMKERPSFLDELISSLTHTIDSIPKKNQPTKVEELANIKLPDEQLNSVFYKMLHGAPYKYAAEDQKGKQVQQPVEEVVAEDSSKDAAQIQDDFEDYKSPKGYVSLLDFITLKSHKKVRVYLAPREVLMAIFNNNDTVDSILNERKALYRQAMRDADTSELEKTFQGSFESKRDPSIDPEMLDFSVTKTNPKDYE
jgi:hypothetical protein